MNVLSLSDYIKKADEYRSQHNLKGGFVLFWNEVPYAWTIDLTKPFNERPGSIAIAEDGDLYRAIDGDDLHGAKRWEACNDRPVF